MCGASPNSSENSTNCSPGSPPPTSLRHLRGRLPGLRSHLAAELAVRRGLLGADDLARCLELAEEAPEGPRALMDVLMEHGLLDEPRAAALLADLKAEDLRSLVASAERPPAEIAALAGDPGRRFGKYVVASVLGEGGMGIVHKAWQEDLGRWVALKILRPGASAAGQARFLQEAQLAARVTHPHLVPIYDVAEIDGVPYITMALLEGGALDVRPMPIREAATIVHDVALAAHEIHGHGVVHRDIKPSNLLRDAQGRVYLGDFGLARSLDVDPKLSGSGTMVGTVQFAPPEQVRGDRAAIGPRSDVYSLGATLYALLAGRPPFVAPDVMSIAQKVLAEDPPPLRSTRPGLHRDLETVCARAMEKRPEDRYASALDFARDLRRFLDGESIAARPLSMRMRAVAWVRRHAAVVFGGAAILIAGTALVAGVQFSRALRRTEMELTETQRSLVEQMRATSRACLEAALELRRAGNVAGMRKYAEQAEAVCRRVMIELPRLAEPHGRLGRIYRAQMKDAEALAEQERALHRDPLHAPALYERVLLLSRVYRRRVQELEDAAWREEGARLLDEGQGEIRPGTGRRPPAGASLARADARAQELMRLIGADLEHLERGTGAISAGELACARGLRAWVQRDLDEARARLEEAAASSPQLEEAYEALAELEAEEGDFEAAARWWSAGIERDRGYVPHLEGRARARGDLGHVAGDRGQDPTPHYDAAVADFSEAIRLDPDRAEAWRGRALGRVAGADCRSGRGEDPGALLQAAIEDLAEAIKRAPDRDDLWMERGGARMNWGTFAMARGQDPKALFETAIADFGEALARNPDRERTWRCRATARGNWGLHRAGQGEDPTLLYEAAIADFGEALRRHPGAEDNWISRGVARMNWGAWERTRGADPEPLYRAAIDDFGQALRLNPDRDETWARRGGARVNWALAKEDRGEDPRPLYQAAIRDFDEALSRNAGRDKTWMWRGAARVSWGVYARDRGEDPAGHYRAAIEDLNAATRLNAGRDESWFWRGRAQTLMADVRADRGEDAAPLYSAAVDDFDRALAINRANATTWRYRGTAQYRWGRWLASRRQKAAIRAKAALESFTEAVRLNPSLEPELRGLIDFCRRHVETHLDE